MNITRQIIISYSNLIFKISVFAVIISTLFLFTNLTTEFYESPKFLVLLVSTLVSLILLTLGFTIKGKVVLVRTPLDIPFLLLLVVSVVSTIMSTSPLVSLLGNQVKIHGSLISFVVYILFYFILVNNLKTIKEAKLIILITTFAGAILSAVSLAAYFGVTLLPPPWIHGVNFTPAGSVFSATAILVLLLPFIISQIIEDNKLSVKIINAFLLTLFSITIVLTASFVIWGIALFSLIITFLILNPVKNLIKTKIYDAVFILAPCVLILFVALGSFLPLETNILYEKSRNFPRELQLPFITSWKISVSAFRDSPFWGSGPSTYLFNFTNYKPVEFNRTNLWNLRFDKAFNEYLEVLANLGGIGLLALISATALFITSSLRVLFGSNEAFQKALSISGLTFFVILALHPSTLVVWVFGILILGIFMAVLQPAEKTVKFDALPGILLVLSFMLVLTAFFFAYKFTVADYHHRLALNAVSQNNGLLAYNQLVEAEKLNPYNDLYRTDIAQTNFALANAIASSKGPTEASPQGSLTEQDKKNIQVLLQQSITEARTAVTLSPRSAVNWEILALLYRQIAGVAQNALAFSLDSYGRAILQDPLNPLLRLNVGGAYYAIKNYDMAVRFFTDSINLKPDFANGYYNLSVALRDKGDLDSAVRLAERVIQLIPDNKSQDYKVASAYLEELKTRIATGSAKQSEVVAPASQTSGALQEEKLPDVLDLPKPEKIATPEPVEKPTPTPVP